MTAIVLDTETTGVDAPEPVQIGWFPISLDLEPDCLGGGFCTKLRPSKPISLGALATHHIMDEDLVDEPPSDQWNLPEDVDYIIGHKVDFDWNVIGSPPDVKRIDVLSMCRFIWPTADSHSLGAMLYMLERQNARMWLRDAHDALTDCWNCLRVLRHVWGNAGPFESFEALWQFSEKARVPTVMAVGKHKGTPINRLPRDYIAWFLKQPDVDPYLRKALENA